MIVQNITGETRYFGFVPRGHEGPNYVRGRTLLPSATATLPDNDADTFAKVQAYVAAGALKIVQGPASANEIASVNLPATGYISCAAGGTSSGDVLTSLGQAFKFAADPGSGVLGTFYSSLSARWAGANNSTPATCMGTLKTAINNAALGVVADTAVLVGTTAYLPLRAAAGNTVNTGLTLVKTTGTNLAVSGATLGAGVSGGARNVAIIHYTVTSADVSAGLIVFSTSLVNVGEFVVQAQTATGQVKAWDGLAQVTGSSIVVDNSGSTDLANTDLLTIIAFEAQ
jgi:hypothetical protein